MNSIRLPVTIRMTTFGAIAQLGERNTGSVEVGGSIPPGSTNKIKHLPKNHQGSSMRKFKIGTGIGTRK